jgi:hypothetical protein
VAYGEICQVGPQGRAKDLACAYRHAEGAQSARRAGVRSVATREALGPPQTGARPMTEEPLLDPISRALTAAFARRIAIG